MRLAWMLTSLGFCFSACKSICSDSFNLPRLKYKIPRLFTASKKKEGKQENEGFPLLEYKPEKPPATAPIFSHGETIETQTTPLPTGKAIEAELKLLVNQLHASHPKSKIAIGTFRSAISKKLKDLGVSPSHTTTYVKKMREFL